MKCANCNCILGRDIFGFHHDEEYECCSEMCCSTKQREVVLHSCNTCILRFKHQIAHLQTQRPEDEGYKVFNKHLIKMCHFINLILVSIRDKKGTYPTLKLKYSEFMDDLMTQQHTSDKVCEVAEIMKYTYSCFELYYTILG
jgi:hypothetical protein